MEVKNFWSKEDDEKLRELWPIKTSYQLMDIFGRSRNSIVARANRLGMKKGVTKKERRNRPKPVKNSNRIVFAKDPAYSFKKVRMPPMKPSDEIKNEPFIGVHLLDIKRDQCRYMHDSQSLMFCGHKVANGSSYCESHHKYMFIGRISLDDREQRYFAK